MAPHTLASHDTRPSCDAIEGDGLMTAILTRHIATSTAYTLVSINLGIDYRLTIELRWWHKVGKFFADDFFKMADTPLAEIMLKSQYEVVDDAVAILHNRRTHLHITATQLDEIKRIAPRLYSAYSTEMYRVYLVHDMM